MGELHLDIYVERMKREYHTECTTGRPQVAFRETINSQSKFSYTHKKQTGGAGQYARIIGHIEPMEMDETGKDVGFENVVMSGNVPSQFIPAVEKVRLRLPSTIQDLLIDRAQGFLEAIEKGSLSGNRVTGCRFVLVDGAAHVTDSSEVAFRAAAIGAFREAYYAANPVIMEPIMKVEVVAPVEFQSECEFFIYSGLHW